MSDLMKNVLNEVKARKNELLLSLVLIMALPLNAIFAYNAAITMGYVLFIIPILYGIYGIFAVLGAAWDNNCVNKTLVIINGIVFCVAFAFGIFVLIFF